MFESRFDHQNNNNNEYTFKHRTVVHLISLCAAFVSIQFSGYVFSALIDDSLIHSRVTTDTMSSVKTVRSIISSTTFHKCQTSRFPFNFDDFIFIHRLSLVVTHILPSFMHRSSMAKKENENRKKQTFACRPNVN